MAIHLTIAKEEDKDLLKNFHQYYLHDLSEYTSNLKLKADGSFDNDDITYYYKSDNLFPYLIKNDEEVVGFILFNLPPNAPEGYNYYISDLFILKSHRKKGYAGQAIEKLFDLRQGRYALLELNKNRDAIGFWHYFFDKFALNYSEVEMTIDNELCLFQGFDII